MFQPSVRASGRQILIQKVRWQARTQNGTKVLSHCQCYRRAGEAGRRNNKLQSVHGRQTVARLKSESQLPTARLRSSAVCDAVGQKDNHASYFDGWWWSVDVAINEIDDGKEHEEKP